MTATSCENFDPSGEPRPGSAEDATGLGQPGFPAAPPEDESTAEIDQYMQALLDRVGQRRSASGSQPPETPQSPGASRSDKSTREATTHGSSSDAPPVEEPSVAAVQDRGSTAGTPPAQDPSTAGEPGDAGASAGGRSQPEAAAEPPAAPRLRPVPAERGCDMSLLREVANASARDAIATHECKQLAQRAYGKLSVALVATFAAILLFHMSSANWSLTFIAAILAALVAVVWGLHHIVLWGRSWLKSPRVPPRRRD